VRFGHKIEMGQGIAIHYLVGAAIKCVGLKALRDLLERTKLPARDLEPFFGQLSMFAPDRKYWSDMARGEYAMALDGMERIRAGRPTGKEDDNSFSSAIGTRLVRPNATLRLLADIYRGFLHDVDWERSNVDFEAPFPEVDPLRDPGNIVGIRIRNGIAETFGKLFFKVYIEELDVSVTRLFFALKLLREARGELPGSLADLAPGFIPAVPIDPFDGEPLRYSREEKKIWSVGRDRIDEEGLEAEADFDLAEPTYRFDL
jgi:hypothetical protein